MKISPISILSPDERGYTAEYYHERLGLQLIIFRKAGTVSGRHYHKGISLSKNPEIFILLSGKMTLNWRDVDSTNIQTAHVIGPARIEIPPYIWHELLMETDCTALELGSITEHKNDTFYDQALPADKLSFNI